MLWKLSDSFQGRAHGRVILAQNSFLNSQPVSLIEKGLVTSVSLENFQKFPEQLCNGKLGTIASDFV